ncbi:MAG: tetratricopeptide repeat protein [Acidobacteria bacterium]|nr:tetratricopeptide repeat protein [Acidobacteriota bacterium]
MRTTIPCRAANPGRGPAFQPGLLSLLITVHLWPLGLLAQSVTDCEAHKHHGRLAETQRCYQQLSNSRDLLQRAEGLWGLGLTQDANNAFRAAAAANPKSPEIKIRWGRFFLERWQKEDAAALFEEAMELKKDHPQALLGMALLASEGFEKKATEFAQKALEGDPKLVEAQALMAQLAVEDVNFDKARTEAEKALKISAESLEAMGVMAALDVLADKPNSPWFDKIAQINPVYAEGYAYVAHVLTINRRYLEAIEFFKKAIEKNPRYWPAHSEIGISYMRLAREKEARHHLELAYNNNHKDPETVNSLRLMDSYANFDNFKTPHGELRLHKKESALLKLYFEQELERAITTFEKKYKVKLKEGVRLEVYPDHEDFAVRTMGMPGLGALGVTFGYVVAMDSPSGRKPGTFHWASTLWHELSHVYALSATNHRVPRWFTEGLAVHEETAVAPDWGDRLDPHMLMAVKDKKLLPVAQLDRGFIRPSYPNQVIVSYFQGGRICDYINQKWGWQTLLDMLHSFADNRTTPEVIEKHLKLKPEEFDKEFLAWLDKQLATPLAKFEDWQKALKLLNNGAREAKADDALNKKVIEDGLKIRDWFPEYVEPGNVYEVVAEAYLKMGNKKSAAAELERYAKVGGRSPATLKKLADLQAEQGRPKDAIATLDKLNFIYPVADPDMHRKMGELCLTTNQLPMAIREFQAALASKPLDPASSYYQLALAYMKANRIADAKEQVINALEAAPGFKPAQKLLLELSSK